jgi:hypothetical protein
MLTSEELTTNLISQAQQIFVDAEAEGRGVDVDERLTSAVSHSVLEGIFAGYQMTATDVDDSDVQPAKRTRLDDSKGEVHLIAVLSVMVLYFDKIPKLMH